MGVFSGLRVRHESKSWGLCWPVRQALQGPRTLHADVVCRPQKWPCVPGWMASRRRVLQWASDKGVGLWRVDRCHGAEKARLSLYRDSVAVLVAPGTAIAVPSHVWRSQTPLCRACMNAPAEARIGAALRCFRRLGQIPAKIPFWPTISALPGKCRWGRARGCSRVSVFYRIHVPFSFSQQNVRRTRNDSGPGQNP